MEIYERIKERRKELGLTALDVAEALGVSRATVYRYESADIEKLPTSLLEPLAVVLKCSPAYLMGWEDVPAAWAAGSGSNGASAPAARSDPGATAGSPSPAADPAVSDPRHDRLLSAYQSLNADGKEKVVEYAEDLAQNPNYVLKNVSVQVS